MFVLDGAAIADGVLAKVAEEARALFSLGVTPGLAVVLVGDNPASRAYVAGKGRAAKACGFHSIQHTLPAETSELELLALVEALNADPAVHGILVQLPLPKAIRSSRILEAIAPNQGRRRLSSDQRGPAVDRGHGPRVHSLHAGRRDDPHRQGLRAARLEPAGHGGGDHRPLQHRRQADGAASASAPLHGDHRSFAHARSPSVARRADILVAAVGQAEMVRGDWVKPGAIVIDVGVNRVAGEALDASGKPKTRLVGDVAYAEAAGVAGAITPVPGGVGRMTIAMLMANTLLAARRATDR